MIAAILALNLAAAQASSMKDLNLQGWDVARVAEGELTLTRVALGDQMPGYPQVWFRVEQMGRGSAVSGLALVEFDCAARRARLLEQFSYSGANLGGRKRPLFVGRAAWRPVGAPANQTFSRTCADPQAR